MLLTRWSKLLFFLTQVPWIPSSSPRLRRVRSYRFFLCNTFRKSQCKSQSFFNLARCDLWIVFRLLLSGRWTIKCLQRRQRLQSTSCHPHRRPRNIRKKPPPIFQFRETRVPSSVPRSITTPFLFHWEEQKVLLLPRNEEEDLHNLRLRRWPVRWRRVVPLRPLSLHLPRQPTKGPWVTRIPCGRERCTSAILMGARRFIRKVLI